TNRILDELVTTLHPRRMTVVGDFAVRGGIHTVVTASHEAPMRRR
ncbi:MAG: NADPH-dependent 7-cyano-7-deazaguanine reductase QueF, partial [Candidatus Methylomirabilota bacterium]